jgi:hypothetical protein
VNANQYQRVRQAVIARGYQEDIDWSEACKLPATPEDFAREFIFVVCNSGMKFSVAVPIFRKVMDAIKARRRVSAVFGHEGKVKAIIHVWRRRKKYFDAFMAAEDKVAFCETLPWIGGITKYHLAKNFGVDCAKPDRHLVRIANYYQTTPEQLCRTLSQLTGDRIATVDVVLWRAAAIGIIETATDTIIFRELK